MIDPDFDPLDILMKQQHRIGQLDQNIKQLAVAYNSRNDLLDQVVENLKQLNTKVHALEIQNIQLSAEIEQLRAGRLLR